jgi:hypothetical protein
LKIPRHPKSLSLELFADVHQDRKIAIASNTDCISFLNKLDDTRTTLLEILDVELPDLVTELNGEA